MNNDDKTKAKSSSTKAIKKSGKDDPKKDRTASKIPPSKRTYEQDLENWLHKKKSTKEEYLEYEIPPTGKKKALENWLDKWEIKNESAQEWNQQIP